MSVAAKPVAKRRLRFFAPSSSMSERILLLVMAAGLVFGAVAGQKISVARLALGAAGALLLFIITTTGRVTALHLVLIWLTFMGLLRRFLIPIAGWSPNDPLLLVAPASAVMLWMSGRRNAPAKKDVITVFGIMFLVIIIGTMAHPNQDPVLAAKSLIFWIPPIVWLFVGRTFPISVHVKLSRLLMILAIPVSLHGLMQSANYFFPFEYTWVGVSGFGAAIFFEGFKVRAFSSLVSPHEYGIFLAISICFVWGAVLTRSVRRRLTVPLLLLLVSALFLQGTRSVFALTMVMFVFTTFVWSKNPAVKLALVAMSVAAIGAIQMKMLPMEWGDGPIATVIEHQVRGLQKPEESTAGLHASQIQRGFERTLESPFGEGLAVTTIASDKAGIFGGNTEFDLTDVAVSFGLVPSMLYILFLLICWAGAIKRYRYHKSAYSLACMGVLIVSLGFFWRGGLYTVSTLVWLMFGGLTRPYYEEAEELQEVRAREEEGAPDTAPAADRRGFGLEPSPQLS